MDCLIPLALIFMLYVGCKQGLARLEEKNAVHRTER